MGDQARMGGIMVGRMRFCFDWKGSQSGQLLALKPNKNMKPFSLAGAKHRGITGDYGGSGTATRLNLSNRIFITSKLFANGLTIRSIRFRPNSGKIRAKIGPNLIPIIRMTSEHRFVPLFGHEVFLSCLQTEENCPSRTPLSLLRPHGRYVIHGGRGVGVMPYLEIG